MIEVIDIHKRYYTDHGMGPWVLQGVNLRIPNGLSVGLVGGNGAGKSTLLRIIGGVDYPSKGEVRRHCKVSWPMGFGGGLQGSMTGRQNTKFVARIHGMEDDIPRILAQVQEFAEIGPAFDEPIKTYSSGMKSRLQFGLSLAFDSISMPGIGCFIRAARMHFAATCRNGLTCWKPSCATTILMWCCCLVIAVRYMRVSEGWPRNWVVRWVCSKKGICAQIT